MIKSIVKRDGRVVLYDASKIASAVLRCLQAAGQVDATVAANVANAVEEALEKECGHEPPQIEQIQDAVEQELMHAGMEEAAKQCDAPLGRAADAPAAFHIPHLQKRRLILQNVRKQGKNLTADSFKQFQSLLG